MNVQFPDCLRPFFGPHLIWRKESSSRVIYLTFDDGPVPEVTPTVLDILDVHSIKATFFCVGENVEKHPEIYNNIISRGHRTGNHSYNHLKGFETENSEYVENIRKAARLIKSRLFRPPYGRIKPKQLKVLRNEFDIVMWDVITHDYDKSLSNDKVFRNVTRYSRNGSIVVFHDSVKAMKEQEPY